MDSLVGDEAAALGEALTTAGALIRGFTVHLQVLSQLGWQPEAPPTLIALMGPLSMDAPMPRQCGAAPKALATASAPKGFAARL